MRVIWDCYQSLVTNIDLLGHFMTFDQAKYSLIGIGNLLTCGTH